MAEKSKIPTEGSIDANLKTSVTQTFNYNQNVFIWDEKKRQANLVKHKLDFVAAHRVYNSPDKLTQRAEGKEKSVMSTQPSSKSTAHASPSSTPIEESISASSPSDPRLEGNATSSQGLVDQTDWVYLRKMQDEDAPIPYDPNDPDETPCDPNDGEAVDKFWDEGERLGLVTRGLTLPEIDRFRKRAS